MIAKARVLPLIIATALLMENIDAAVLATSLPEIARDLESDPIHLKLVLTTYLLALAVFILGSGWAADPVARGGLVRAGLTMLRKRGN